MRELINKLKYAFIPHTVTEAYFLKVGDIGNYEIFIKEAVKVSGYSRHQTTTSNISEAVNFTALGDCLAYKKTAELGSEIKVIKRKVYSYAPHYNYM